MTATARTVTVTGFREDGQPSEHIDEAARYMINKAMARMYLDGFRRFRTTRLPDPDYDSREFQILGWTV
jgi:hypothetical protein